MKKIARLAAIGTVCVVALEASATDYELQASVGLTSEAFTAAACNNWKDIATGNLATGAITSSDDCYIVGGKYITTGSKTPSFPGHALHIGSEDASANGFLLLGGNFSCSDLRWHNGSIYNRSGGSNPQITGNITLDHADKTHKLYFTTATPGSTGHWANRIPAKLVCEDTDVVLDVLLNDNATTDCYSTSGNKPSLDAQIALSGNNTGFKGKIKVSKFGHLALAHANAAGDPGTTRADAIELAANSRLTVANSITPNAARGITITGADAQIHARTYGVGWTDCNTFTLPMPITGTYGLTKMGDGTVTLSGAYTAGDLVVSNGTLILDAAGSFPRGLKVTIHDGATLVQNEFIPAIDVDCKEGGTYTKGYSFVVPYNPETGVSTPFDFTDGIPDEDGVLPISLSAAIALPIHSTNRIDLAQLPSDTTATAADFEDRTPKTYGLPNSWLEIESRGGSKFLVLVAKPVVVSVKTFANTTGGLGGSGDRWSDGEVARAGFDYLVTNVVDGLTSQFNGDAVTITKNSNSAIALRNQISYIGKATLYPGNIIYPNNGAFTSFRFSSGDSIYLPDDGTERETVFETRWASGAKCQMRVNLNIPLSGDGKVLIRGKNQNARNFGLSGNNSGFTGTIRFSSYENYSASDYARIHISAPEALGGSPASFVYNAIQLLYYSHLVVGTSFTLETANRGIYVTTGGFDVTNGATLTVKQPVRVNGELYKDGKGTLALGGAVSFGVNGTTTGAQNAFFVREGAVKALSDAAVAGFATTFSDGTRIVVAANPAVTNGFTGTVAFESGATVTVEAESVAADGVTVLPICTVADDSLVFTPQRVTGFRGEIVKTYVTLGETPCVRYSVKYAPAGFTVIMR